jgi:hypothetical protein
LPRLESQLLFPPKSSKIKVVIMIRSAIQAKYYHN